MPRLVSQLSNLERRTTRIGRDIVDHPPGGHDDVANAAAGALVLALGTVAKASGFDLAGVDSRYRFAIAQLRPRVERPSRFGLGRRRGGLTLGPPSGPLTGGGPLSGWSTPVRDTAIEFRLLTLCRAAGLLSDEESGFLASDIRRLAFAQRSAEVGYTDPYDATLGCWSDFIRGTHPLVTPPQKEKTQ